MRNKGRWIALFALFVAASMIVGSGIASASTPAKASKATHAQWGPHHGRVVKTKAHFFETVYTPQGINVYVFNLDHSPISLAAGVSGTATLKLHDRSTREVALTLQAGDQPHLTGMTDVLMATKRPIMVTVKLTGLDGVENMVTFRETYSPRSVIMKPGEVGNPPAGVSPKRTAPRKPAPKQAQPQKPAPGNMKH